MEPDHPIGPVGFLYRLTPELQMPAPNWSGGANLEPGEHSS